MRRAPSGSPFSWSHCIFNVLLYAVMQTMEVSTTKCSSQELFLVSRVTDKWLETMRNVPTGRVNPKSHVCY